MGEPHGQEIPRIFTRPLVELTPQTSRGFEFIEFCRRILGVDLYPWQRWLAIHALELNTDGSYRYSRILVIVSRQQGKTMLASCLAAWWLYMDYAREPGKSPAEFTVLGAAQNLNIAEKPFEQVQAWTDPNPRSVEEKARTIPALSARTLRIRRVNGNRAIETRHGPRYIARDGANARGETAARVLLDEVREQKTWRTWKTVEAFPQTFRNGQIWAISSGGEADSIVMKTLRKQIGEQVELAAREGADYPDHDKADTSLAIFEWSAPDDCDPLDEAAILQANPSIGHSAVTVASIRSKYRTHPELEYRTEYLGQTVEAKTIPFIDPRDFRDCVGSEADYQIAGGERVVFAVDTAVDRSRSCIAAAVMCDDGIPLVALLAPPRLGMMWLPADLEAMARAAGHSEVMVQERGCPAMEFRQPLADLGLQVRAVPGSWFGIATGRFRDAIRDRRVRFVKQEPLELAIAAGITKRYGETDAWDRRGSAVDISPLVACTLALYGLENPVDVPLSAYADHDLLIL